MRVGGRLVLSAVRIRGVRTVVEAFRIVIGIISSRIIIMGSSFSGFNGFDIALTISGNIKNGVQCSQFASISINHCYEKLGMGTKRLQE